MIISQPHKELPQMDLIMLQEIPSSRRLIV
jgi:hypothetical protein